MAFADRVKDTVSVGGTGAITVTGTPPNTSFRPFSAIGAAGTTFDYCMEDGTNYEVGVGTVGATANTFTRVVTVSSNANAAVNFAAGANFFVGTQAATFAAFLTAAGAATLTNKRVSARVVAGLTTATPLSGTNTDTCDRVQCLALAAVVSSMSTGGGTPVAGDTLTVDLKSASAFTINWGTLYEASTIALPGVLVANALMTVYFEWNTATSKWRCVGYV